VVDSTTFTNVSETWWFNGDHLETTALELRKDIGEKLGNPRESQWYLDGTKLQELYKFLEDHDRELLHRVDEATDDLSRLVWLQAVATLLNPSLTDSDPASSKEAEQVGDGSAEEAEPVAPTGPSPEPSVPAASSPFGSATGTEIPERLQPAVDDLAAVVADVVASVPGAADLSAEELTELVAEVLAER
jgi:hypothetical protein